MEYNQTNPNKMKDLTLEIQRKLNNTLKGGDWPTIDELVGAFEKRELADKLIHWVGNSIALKEINQRLKEETSNSGSAASELLEASIKMSKAISDGNNILLSEANFELKVAIKKAAQ